MEVADIQFQDWNHEGLDHFSSIGCLYIRPEGLLKKLLHKGPKSLGCVWTTRSLILLDSILVSTVTHPTDPNKGWAALFAPDANKSETVFQGVPFQRPLHIQLRFLRVNNLHLKK